MGSKSKVRLYDLAKELKVDTKRLIADVRSEGVNVSVPSNQVSKELADKIRDRYYSKTIKIPEEPLNLTYRPFGDLISNSTTVESTSLRDPTWPTRDKTLRAAKKEKARLKIRRKKPVPKRKNIANRKLQLVYEPPRVGASLPSRPKTRRCPTCRMPCPTKSDLRGHLISAHMNDVMTGKVSCRVTAYELCRATHADLQKLTAIAVRMGCKIRRGTDYVPPMLVKELVSQLAARIDKVGDNRKTAVSRAYKSIVPTPEVKLNPELLEELEKKGFGQLRSLIDDA